MVTAKYLKIMPVKASRFCLIYYWFRCQKFLFGTRLLIFYTEWLRRTLVRSVPYSAFFTITFNVCYSCNFLEHELPSLSFVFL